MERAFAFHLITPAGTPYVDFRAALVEPFDPFGEERVDDDAFAVDEFDFGVALRRGSPAAFSLPPKGARAPFISSEQAFVLRKATHLHSATEASRPPRLDGNSSYILCLRPLSPVCPLGSAPKPDRESDAR